MSDESCKSVREVDLDKSKVSNVSDIDMGLMKDDPLMVEFLQDIMSSKMMGKLVSRSPSYICSIPNDDDYISTLGNLEVSVYGILATP